MATRQAGSPYFGNPPKEYDQRFFADLVRAFAQYVALASNPGEMRGTKIVLTDLPASDVGLEPGTLYRSGNAVFISQLDIAGLSSSGMTVSDGAVTVLTP